jgi:hypothetical protein
MQVHVHVVFILIGLAEATPDDPSATASAIAAGSAAVLHTRVPRAPSGMVASSV